MASESLDRGKNIALGAIAMAIAALAYWYFTHPVHIDGLGGGEADILHNLHNMTAAQAAEEYEVETGKQATPGPSGEGCR